MLRNLSTISHLKTLVGKTKPSFGVALVARDLWNMPDEQGMC